MLSYLRNKDGVFAIKFAIAIPLLLLCCGFAVDGYRLVHAHSQLQTAADSAVLAAAIENRNENGDWRVSARDTFKVNSSHVEFKSEPFVRLRETTSDTIEFTANAELKPAFVQIFGFPNMGIHVEAEANLSLKRKAEVAILFDLSSSLHIGGIQKYEAAQTAVTNLLTEFGNQNSYSTSGTVIWAGLVPFGERVSIAPRDGITNNNVLGLNWFGPFEEHSPTEFDAVDPASYPSYFPSPYTDRGMCPELRPDTNLHDDSPPGAGLFPIWYKKYWGHRDLLLG